jgi:hypothetical protein
MAQSPTITATGRVCEYGEVVTRGKWSKRTVVLEIEPPGEYKGKYLAVDFGGKRLADADDLAPGDTITVVAYVGSREYQGRWYHDIAAKSVKVEQRAGRVNEQAADGALVDTAETVGAAGDGEDGGTAPLPF